MTNPPNVNAFFKFYLPGGKHRSFYSSSVKGSGYDYMTYVDTGVKAGKVQDYMDYAGNPEKSSGVFSRNGLLSPKEKAKFRKELRTTGSAIWDCVISLSTEFGKDKFRTYKDCMEIINKEFPRFFKENEMPYDNIQWFAGLHENTDNRHFHMAFWEKEPLRVKANQKGRFFHKGKLKQSSIDGLKVRIEERLTTKEFDLKSQREKLLKEAKETLEGVDENAIYSKKFKSKLLEVFHKLPKSGDCHYSSKNMDEARPLIKDIVMLMMANNPELSKAWVEINESLKKRDKKIEGICQRDKLDSKKYLLREKFKEDFMRRMGNMVIDHAKKAQSQDLDEHCRISDERRQRWREKKQKDYLLGRAMRLSRDVNEEMDSFLKEWQGRLKKAEHDRKIESGEIQSI